VQGLLKLAENKSNDMVARANAALSMANNNGRNRVAIKEGLDVGCFDLRHQRNMTNFQRHFGSHCNE
jgi:hypothetical protein